MLCTTSNNSSPTRVSTFDNNVTNPHRVGRIGNRLPPSLADQVLDGIFEMMGNVLSSRTVGGAGRILLDEPAWHGSCLALGEFARRGLILPSRLPAGKSPLLLARYARSLSFEYPFTNR